MGKVISFRIQNQVLATAFGKIQQFVFWHIHMHKSTAGFQAFAKEDNHSVHTEVISESICIDI